MIGSGWRTKGTSGTSFFPNSFPFLELFGASQNLGLMGVRMLPHLFAMRAMRRLNAVDLLFKNGFYLESHLLVRAGYEDWICLAYLLKNPGLSRCATFGEGVFKLDPRAYDSFKALCGKSIADRYFGVLPKSVADFVGIPRSKTQPLPFAMMADDVSLRGVHDFVYVFASSLD